MRPALSICAESAMEPETLGMRVDFRWGDTPLGTHVLSARGKRALTLGTAPQVDFPLHARGLGAEPFVLATADDRLTRLRVPPGAEVELLREGRALDEEVLRA